MPQNPSDRVVIIPQGSLFQVPCPALKRADGSDLIDHHTLVTALSIQVLGLAQQARDRRLTHRDEVLIVGNPTMPAIWSPQQQTRQPLPTLPGAQQEASAIADLFNT
ncbi:MAG: CHAT domain-containing protein [Leptolyngbyaceae cyanobacterium T60_A2020_046]|nr:CHAT domain-containing protein [Leptolyngbyaceae cyanobacterium T60_A2020_046]